MNNSHQQESPLESGQSPGYDPKTSKRNSGLFSFFKWFKPSVSRESIDTDAQNSHSSSCDSLTSIQSNGTVASFSYVPPSAYNNGRVNEKCVALGPETDTYKARLKQRDKRRENDKNLTLRKKYNLFFNRDTLLKSVNKQTEDENTKSLPLMTRTATMDLPEEKLHRRTNSESSKIKKAGAYLHVKGKRKAPQPPGNRESTSTSSLRRKKRLAPPPPKTDNEKTNDTSKYDSIVYADADIIFNDSLKLDHGILKPAKDTDAKNTIAEQTTANEPNSPTSSARSSYVEPPVSPRPWYKRNSNRNSMVSKKEKDTRNDHKYEPVERLPEVSFMRNSTIDLTVTEDAKIEKKKEEKRKSGLTFLTNISELDREACEIIKKEHMKNGNDIHQEMPEFMRPKQDDSKINTDSWVSPKRRSARDLIAKFNAITNVTKTTVNSAFFGVSHKERREYFGKQISLPEDKKQEALLESHRKRIEKIDNRINEEKSINPLMKSESTSAIKHIKPETPKSERKNWNCPKCGLPNEYWRIICHVCSAIKPYFDDFSSQPAKSNDAQEIKIVTPKVNNSPPLGNSPDRILERSKTQIGFSALASYNLNQAKNKRDVAPEENSPKSSDNKKEEREKLKKMLIEMKNSLPKRKSNILTKQNSRTSIIVENPENTDTEIIETKDDKGAEENTRSAENKSDGTDKNNLKHQGGKNVEIQEKSDLKQKKYQDETYERAQEGKVTKSQEEKVAEILIGKTETIYENIKVKKTENPKPIKVSASAQTSSVVKKIIPESEMSELLKSNVDKMRNNFELMRPKDFEDIYSDNNTKSAARIYANLARNDELSLFFNVPKEINDMKKRMDANNVENPNTDTIEINRLLRRLETAIAKGEMTEAAIFAKELAQLKINCSVIRQKPNHRDLGKEKGFSIEMYVEDKISHRGPFPIQVTENQSLGELKQQIEREFDIPANVQRWILGKELATKDSVTLKEYKITAGCPVFLYLVAPENKANHDAKATSNFKNVSTENKQSEKISSRPASNINTTAPSETPSVSKIFPEKVEAKESSKVTRSAAQTEEFRQTKTEATTSASSAPKVVSVIPKVVESIAKEQLKLSGASRKVTPTKTENIVITRRDSAEVKPVIVDVSNKVIKTPDFKPSPNNEAVNIQITETKLSTEIKLTEEVKNKNANQPPKIATGAKAKHGGNSETKINIKVEPKVKYQLDVKQQPPEDEDYDAKTLKPQANEWECHLCTLLNPITSNICAVCATVRIKDIKVKKTPKKKAPQPKELNKETNDLKEQTYLQLVNLDNADLVENTETFECVICYLDVPPGQGVTLRECLHQFCKVCLAQTIEYTEEAEVKCPYRDDQYSCNIALQDREVKALVTPAAYEKFLAKSIAQAENKIRKSFHCKSPDCKGWCIFEDNVNEFRCPVCYKVNCLTCQAIHTNMNCKQYQERMNKESDVDENARRTKEMLEEMVAKGEAIECPTCQVILMKKWGCDWLRCSMCKTEICWVTRGPRWGPAGKGDTSGGCQCGVNGVKCHPQCNYCH